MVAAGTMEASPRPTERSSGCAVGSDHSHPPYCLKRSRLQAVALTLDTTGPWRNHSRYVCHICKQLYSAGIGAADGAIAKDLLPHPYKYLLFLLSLHCLCLCHGRVLVVGRAC
jgi:hypothetical protein